jgi:Ulp1 family protease
MWSLLPAEDALIAAFFAQQGNPDDVVAEEFVERAELLKLNGQQRLNDTLVDAWRSVFRRRVTEGPTSDMLPIYFYKCLMSNYGDYNYNNVRNYTRKLGDVFALDRLFVPLFVSLTNTNGVTLRDVSGREFCRCAFAMVDMNAHSITYYDAYSGVRDDVAAAILQNLRRWLRDEHLHKRGARLGETYTLCIASQSNGVPRLSDYVDDGIFLLKGIELLSRGKTLSFFNDGLMPNLRRHVAFEILTGKLVHDEGRRRAHVNVLILLFAAKIAVLAIRARKRTWEPDSVHVATLGAAFLSRTGSASLA